MRPAHRYILLLGRSSCSYYFITLCSVRQEAQQSRGGGLGGPAYSFGGFTPQAASGNTPGNLLSTGQTPHNMLGR